MVTSDLPFAVLPPATLLLLALLLNLLLCSFGRVSTLFATPTALAARLIGILEARYNTPHATETMRRTDSVSVTAVLVLLGLAAGLALDYGLTRFAYSWAVEAVLVATLINPRPHLERMRILERALDGDTEEARATLTLVTGRDARQLGPTGLAAAGIESTGMALVQGLLAPFIWYWLGGLPLLLAFKIVDTASVMIDERAEHARSFGWAPRALSAVFVAPAAALSGPALLLASLLTREAHARGVIAGLRAGGRYAWPVFSIPIAALAGALGVRLGGPVCIGSFERDGDIFTPTGTEPAPSDIARTRRLFVLSGVIMALGLAALGALKLAHPLPVF